MVGMGDWGFGLVVCGEGEEKIFLYGGRDQGFDVQFIVFVEGGCGVVLMINMNNNIGFLCEVFDVIVCMYDWFGKCW